VDPRGFGVGLEQPGLNRCQAQEQVVPQGRSGVGVGASPRQRGREGRSFLETFGERFFKRDEIALDPHRRHFGGH
jgi:hypothetical protein